MKRCYYINMKVASALVIVAVVGCAISAQAATVAYWRFEGNNGSVVADGTVLPDVGTPIRDEIGGNHPIRQTSGISWQGDDAGELFGAAVPVSDPIDTDTNGTLNAGGVNTRSLYFDSTKDHLIIADNDTLDFAGEFTIDGYFRTNTQGIGTILDKRPSSTTVGGYKVFIDATGVLSFGVDNGPTWGWVGFDDFSLNDDQWHHFAAIRDSSDGLHIWVDGVEDITPATNGIMTISGDLSNSSDLLIGADQAVNPDRAFNGYLDEIRFSDASGTKAYWRFEGNNGSVVVDGTSVPTTGTPIRNESISSSHGIASDKIAVTTTTWQGDDAGEIFGTMVPNPDPLDTDTNGTLNAGGFNTRSLYFDSSNDHLVVADDDSLDFAGEFTIEGYFRAAPTGDSHMILDKSGGDAGYKVSLNPDGKLIFSVNDGLTTGIVGFDNQLLSDDAWHHFAAIRDSSGGLHIWVDGFEDLTPLIIGSTTVTGDLSNSENLLIGNDYRLDDAKSFDGYLDEIRFSDVALTPDQFLSPGREYSPGDANYDGAVDGDDAAILATNWLMETEAGWAAGDFNEDGIVDDIDATIMAANWGAGPGGGNVAVPEPASLVMIVVGLMSILLLRRTRK